MIGLDAGAMTDDLATYAITRDPALRDVLAVKHLPLVKFVARKLSANLPGYVEVDDLVSWGCLGLLDALDKFEPARGHQFSTYAVTRIRGAILDGLQQMDWAPKQVTSKVRAMRRMHSALQQEFNREPTDTELAERLECTEADIRGWRVDHNAQRVKGLDAPAVGEDEGPGIDVAEDGDQELAGEVGEIRSRVCAAMSALDEREREVFLLYYRDGLTLRQIAAQLGVSVSSATQTHTRLVELVRERLAAFGAVA